MVILCLLDNFLTAIRLCSDELLFLWKTTDLTDWCVYFPVVHGYSCARVQQISLQ